MLSLLFIWDGNGSYEQYAAQLQKGVQHLAQTVSPQDIPGFKTDSPPETELQSPDALEERSAHSKNEASNYLKQSAEIRALFRLDVERDSLTRGSELSLHNAETVLSGKIQVMEEDLGSQKVICQEGRPLSEFTCTRTLQPPVFEVEPPKYSNWWCTSGAHQPDDPDCTAKAYYSPARLYKPEQIHIRGESWSSTCRALEEKTAKGLCTQVSEVCPGGPETRDITGQMGEKTVTRQITRPCWRYVRTFRCNPPSLDSCKDLRAKGWEQIDSKCFHHVQGACVTWEQTFRCPKGDSRIIQGPPLPFPQTPPPLQEAPNGDLNDGLSKLSILKEIQEELKDNGEAIRLPLIFKGRALACTVAFAGFKNCCSTGKGWGISLGLSGCSGEEKDLADRSERGLCHEIGTYCAEKLLGICIRKKRSSCCFPSKLSRILHEQGRAQLGKDWGTPENPACDGFQPEEIARINFDQLDLREVFEEVAARVKHRAEHVVSRNLAARLSDMTRGFRKQGAGDQ